MALLQDFLQALIKSETDPNGSSTANQATNIEADAGQITQPIQPTTPEVDTTQIHASEQTTIEELKKAVIDLQNKLAQAQQANTNLLLQTPIAKEKETISSILRSEEFHPLYEKKGGRL